jgi:mono/diheme cytochrome c family protein
MATANLFAADDTAIPERVTYYKDVAPIVQENCQQCHRPGGEAIAGMVAPMSLMSYEEVRPWAKSLQKLVQDRQMPPWDATDVTSGQFLNERTLTDTEIEILVRWVAQRAPAGNPADAPAPRIFNDNGGWVIGTPDLIVYMDEPYFVRDEVADVQPRTRITITEEMLPEPLWIQAVEYKPDSEVVHHITGSASNPAGDRFSIGSIAAGEDPTIYPPGFGNILYPGAVLNLSLHYHKETGPGTGVWDQSAVGFKFHPKDVEITHKVRWGGMGGNSGFEIPPRHPDWQVSGARIFNEDTLLLSLHPHMHYRGKDMKYTITYPDGTTEVLLDVPRYDYAWQTNYIYKEPKLIPAGSVLDVITHYDNSEARKAMHDEININRPVRFGAASTDEMNIPFVAWAPAEPNAID